MKRYSKITPEGSRDFLFEECDELEDIMIEIDEYLGLLPSDLSEKIS